MSNIILQIENLHNKNNVKLTACSNFCLSPITGHIKRRTNLLYYISRSRPLLLMNMEYN